MKPRCRVPYRCARGHYVLLRITSLHPDPDRWEGTACGYCSRDGIRDQFLTRDGEEPAYVTRFIPQADAAALVNLYHLARTVVGQDRHARKVQASTWYADEHPGVTALGAYKDLEGLLA